MVDEVYANQVYPTKFNLNPQPFVSILSLDIPLLTGCNPSRIHVLAGPSKDLGASGVKIGALVSQNNPELVQLIRAGTSNSPLSTASDAVFTSILNDEKFLLWFLEENRRRLRNASEFVCDWLEDHGIPSGLFNLFHHFLCIY
jgi:aspartate/methionine/tyrosine aminotransferase